MAEHAITLPQLETLLARIEYSLDQHDKGNTHEAKGSLMGIRDREAIQFARKTNMNKKNLQDVLAGLYASEINVSISTFWDGGYDVKLGLAPNCDAETCITIDEKENGLDGAYTVREVSGALDQVAEWLHEAALLNYPDSVYAQEFKVASV